MDRRLLVALFFSLSLTRQENSEELRRVEQKEPLQSFLTESLNFVTTEAICKQKWDLNSHNDCKQTFCR